MSDLQDAQDQGAIFSSDEEGGTPVEDAFGSEEDAVPASETKVLIQRSIEYIQRRVYSAEQVLSSDDWVTAFLSIAEDVMGTVVDVIFQASVVPNNVVAAVYLNTALDLATRVITANSQRAVLPSDPELFFGHWKMVLFSLRLAEKACN